MTDLIKSAIDRALTQYARDSIDESADDYPRGPFDFYPAVAVRPSPEQFERMIVATMRSEPSLTREAAEAILLESQLDEILLSSEYQVAIRKAPNGFGHEVVHLSIKRVDKEPIHDWRALQSIKNAIVGDECEAIEIYPAESRLVDGANQYHLWAFIDDGVRVPVGFVTRLVDEVIVGKSKQRRFESREALWPSKAQLANAVRDLYGWIESRDFATLRSVKDEARALLDQIDRANGERS